MVALSIELQLFLCAKMTFRVPYSSSPPSTPDKSRSYASNLSTTPAGPPPSSVGSTTPSGPPPRSAFASSQFGSRGPSKLSFAESAFSESVNSQESDDLLGFSTNSANSPFPRARSGAAPRFVSRNNFAASGGSSPFRESDRFGYSTGSRSEFGSSVAYSDDVEEEEEEDAGDNMDAEMTGMEASRTGLPTPQSKGLARKALIYSNPNNAKRAKLDESWVRQSPPKPKLPARKKASTLPSIARDFAARSSIAEVQEPDGLVLDSDDVICRLYDQVREYEADDDTRLQPLLSEISEDLIEIWHRYTKSLTNPQQSGRKGEIGPGDSSTKTVKATFLGSLLLPLHHPPVSRRKRDSHLRRNVPGDTKSQEAASIPRVLLDWINGNHLTQPGAIESLHNFQPNPTMSPTFWNVIQASVLRGEFLPVIKLLEEADFNYARSAMEDGYDRPGYRGIQLQNTQQCVNNVVKLLRTSPGVQFGNWDLKDINWTMYRQQIVSEVTELEDLVENPDQIAGGEDQFQAPHFGISLQRNNSISTFSHSTRMAESQIPWAIYENIKAVYSIILGDVSAIVSHSQDWVEATIGLTVWWDGDDDSDISIDSVNGNRNSKLRPQSNGLRSVDANPSEAYLRRLDYAFGCVTDGLGNEGFSINSTNVLEVGLASIFEGNVEVVLKMLQTWSLPIASGIAEIASFGGWLNTSAGSHPMPGFNENDLMVLSYGQTEKPLQKDDILVNYAIGILNRKPLKGSSGSRDGWELALEVLSRLDDQETMKVKVNEVLSKMALGTADEVDKIVLLCTELGFNEEGRKASEVCPVIIV